VHLLATTARSSSEGRLCISGRIDASNMHNDVMRREVTKRVEWFNKIRNSTTIPRRRCALRRARTEMEDDDTATAEKLTS
jgi:hypothetical protein